MKYSKWIEKVGKIFDKELQKANVKFAYENAARGFYFANSTGTTLYFVENQSVLSAKDFTEYKGLCKLFEENAINGVLAKSITPGSSNAHGMHYNLFRFNAGDYNVYVNSKLLKDFPKNTLFYTCGGRTKPVLACIENENGAFSPIALVFPINLCDNDFVQEENAS